MRLGLTAHLDRRYYKFIALKQRGTKTKQKMGVEKVLLSAGTGPKPVRGQNVTVHCTGFGFSLLLSLVYCCLLAEKVLIVFSVACFLMK